MSMSGQNPKVGAVRRWRVGVVGVLLAVLCATGLMWQTSTQAGGAPLEPQVAAIVKDNQIVVAVALGKETPQRLSGALMVELIGPGEKSLALSRIALANEATLTSH